MTGPRAGPGEQEGGRYMATEGRAHRRQGSGGWRRAADADLRLGLGLGQGWGKSASRRKAAAM